MRNLIVAAFLEPVTEGLEFPRDDWPLHVTLAKFDVDVPDSATAPGPDQLADRIAGLMAAPVTAALGSPLSAGGEAGFGRSGLVPVSLILPSGPLQVLHEGPEALGPPDGVRAAALAGPCPAPLRHIVNTRPVLAPRSAILGSDSMLT